jgi:hydrogenase expression/formation protein HypE
MCCPVEQVEGEVVQMAHGAGGKLTHRLIQEVFGEAFKNEWLSQWHDATILPRVSDRLAFTTDSYVVKPLFFPGGDIGSLAVNGTVNDLAMAGARPAYLSAAFVLEEGFPIESLRKIARSMRDASKHVGISIVAGDTKVVDRGKGDGVFINTTGIGIVENELCISPRNVGRGDIILISGDLARHGIAILSAREGLDFESEIASDCAPLWEPVAALLAAGIAPRCLRDLTRGGLATALAEIAQVSGLTPWIDEERIEVREDVRGACEILGLDPLYVANEGRFLAIVPADQAARALDILRATAVSRSASIIGEMRETPRPLVLLRSAIGTERVLDLLVGDPLPRIC